MKILATFYVNMLRSVAVVLGLMSAYVVQLAPAQIHKVVVSGSVLGGLFLLAEWLIRTKIWRIGLLYRKLDFKDNWRCVTFYEVERSPQGSSTEFKTFHTIHDAVINQDSRDIRIAASAGGIYKRWESIMMTTTESGGVAYTYGVDYADNTLSRGYEDLSVIQRFPNDESGKPILMIGTFSHCIQDGKAAYRGTAVFCSSKHFSEIVASDALPEQAKQAITLLTEPTTKNG
jgi:hypothetical protein